MGRILRIELRRSAAAGIALLSLVVGTGILLTYPEGFAGRWLQLAVSARFMLTLLVPLALAGGAWLGQRDARSGVGELFASTVRPRWQRLLPTAGALATTVVIGYALMFLIGAAWVAPTAGYLPATAIAVTAVGGLSLVAAGWLGMAAGRAVPRLITAPVLAVAGLVAVGFLPGWLHINAVADGRPVPAALLLAPAFSGDLHDFETIVAPVHLLQAVWLVALAGTALLLLGVVRRRAIALAAVPAVLGAAVMLPLLPGSSYAGAVAVDSRAVELVCDEDGPRVCVTRVHAGLLPDVAAPAREALTLLAAKLPDAPTRAVESRQLPSWALSSGSPARAQADTLVFAAPPIGPGGRADLADEDFRQNLLEAAWRPDCGDHAVTLDVLLAQAVGAAWLTGQPPAAQSWWRPEERQQVESAYQALVGLPADEQGRQMAAVRDAALDCRTEALWPILDGAAP